MRARVSVDRETDLLVVGLGPAGSSAAASAAERGLSVLAVEKKAEIGLPVQCAELVSRFMGRYARCAPIRVQPIECMRTRLPSGAYSESSFPGWMIDRTYFDQAIARRAAGAGATLWRHTCLVGLEPAERIAVVARGDGHREGIRYHLMIAADGPHSRVAALLGLAPLQKIQARQYTVPLRQPSQTVEIWLADAYAGGYAWLFPKGPVAHLGVGGDRQWVPDLKTALEPLRQQLVAAQVIGPGILSQTGGAIPVSGLRPSLVQGRILMVGDAAGLTHAITGAGIASAVVSGERAGRAAAEYLGGIVGALEDFDEDMRDQFAQTLQRSVDRRAWLAGIWHTPEAARDGVMRRGWITFSEYYLS
jgi:digeranylgeranylglycerophospholipid reductase